MLYVLPNRNWYKLTELLIEIDKSIGVQKLQISKEKEEHFMSIRLNSLGKMNMSIVTKLF